jgi:hypothetical protein
MKTATKTFTAFTAAAILATGMFAGSSQEAAAGWKGKHAAGAFVAGAIVGSVLSHGHHHRHRYYARECWYEKRLIKVGRNTYKKRNVKICR